MKILVGNIPLPQNRFLVDLNDSLAKKHEVVHCPDTFWNVAGDFDVLHLHFPEYMTFAHEDAYRTGLDNELIEATVSRLSFWRKKTKIVVTRHVLLPHDALEDPQWEKMYEAVYSQVHGVVHFATASIDEFRKRYKDTVFAHGDPEHTVIPHHNYASLPNFISRETARDRLGIKQDRNVMLVFGSIRNLEERDLILNTFKGLYVPKKLLLVSRWKERLADVSWVRLKYWLRDLKRTYYNLHPGYNFNYSFVEEEDTQLYLNAADVLFIPRLKVLNSGNITLGMTFGKVVVGPDSWDVGQLLRETGNPVFETDRPASAIPAMKEGFYLAAEGIIGQANQNLAFGQWSADQCADAYHKFYKRILNSAESTCK